MRIALTVMVLSVATQAFAVCCFRPPDHCYDHSEFGSCADCIDYAPDGVCSELGTCVNHCDESMPPPEPTWTVPIAATPTMAAPKTPTSTQPTPKGQNHWRELGAALGYTQY